MHARYGSAQLAGTFFVSYFIFFSSSFHFAGVQERKVPQEPKAINKAHSYKDRKPLKLALVALQSQRAANNDRRFELEVYMA